MALLGSLDKHTDAIQYMQYTIDTRRKKRREEHKAQFWGDARNLDCGIVVSGERDTKSTVYAPSCSRMVS